MPKAESEEIDHTVIKKRLLLKSAMTSFVRSDKQVMTRQTTKMCMCSSRNAGKKLECQAMLRVGSHTPSCLCGLWPLPKEPHANSERDNVNRKERQE